MKYTIKGSGPKPIPAPAPKPRQTRQDAAQADPEPAPAVTILRSTKSPDGIHYSEATCPMQCCLLDKPCPDCQYGSGCVLCGRGHRHGRVAFYCSRACAEGDIVNAPRAEYKARD